MSESDSEGEGGLAAAGFAPPSASASEQGSAREVSVSLRGAAVTVAQDPLAGGHHGTVWDGARALLALIDASPRRADALRGRRVLEVGAGTGVLGLALARALGCAVVLTDLPAAVPALRANAARNYAGARVRCSALEWGATRPEQLRGLFSEREAGSAERGEAEEAEVEAAAAAAEEVPFDFVVGTDVVFSESLTPLLVATVAAVAERSDELFAQQRRRFAGGAAGGAAGAAGGEGGGAVPARRSCTVIFANEVRDLQAQAAFERAVAAHGLAPARPLRRRDLPPPWRDEEVLLIFEMRLRGRRGAGAGAGEEAEAAEGADEGGDAASR